MARSADIDDETLATMLLQNFRLLETAYHAGAQIPHPSRQYNADKATIRGLRGDAASGTLESGGPASGRLEETDTPVGDDPSPNVGAPLPERNGRKLAAHDSARRFRSTMSLDRSLYDRVGSHKSQPDDREVDSDMIVQPRPCDRHQ